MSLKNLSFFGVGLKPKIRSSKKHLGYTRHITSTLQRAQCRQNQRNTSTSLETTPRQAQRKKKPSVS